MAVAAPAHAGDGGGAALCGGHKIVRSGAHANWVECHKSGMSKVLANVHDDKRDKYCAVLTIRMRSYRHAVHVCGAGKHAGYTTKYHKGNAKLRLGLKR
ncbi:hypothetical protein, partial [Streptomyces albus]